MLAKKEIVVRSDMIVRESLSENMPFELLSICKGASHMDKYVGALQMEGTAHAKAQENTWEFLGKARRSVYLEQNNSRGDQ